MLLLYSYSIDHLAIFCNWVIILATIICVVVLLIIVILYDNSKLVTVEIYS